MEPNAKLLCETILQFFERNNSAPLIIGICGPQGCGKSTLSGRIAEILCEKHSITTVVLSLDDYYLPYQELQQLYQSTASSLYEFRGNPGTHDTALLAQHLKVLKARGQIDAPVYDKLARNGIGDRRGTRIVDPADIVIFEGWMLGFTAKQNVNLHLQALNEMLKSYEDIWKLIDNWIFLKVEDLESIYEWRWEQELENCRRRGVQCRSRAEIDDFVSRFIPTYLTYYIPRPDAIVMKLDTKRTISRS